MRMSDCDVPHHMVDVQQNMSITDLLANVDCIHCRLHPLIYADWFAHATPSNQIYIQGQALSVGMMATHVLLLSPVLPPMQDKKKYERARELLYLEDQFNIAKRVVSDEQCHACCTQMCCVSVRRRQRSQA